MQNPKALLRDYMLTLGEPKQKGDVRSFYLVQDPDTGERWVEKDYYYTYTIEQIGKFQELVELCEKYDRWDEQALQQVYVQQKREELRKVIPQEYELKKVAVTIAPPPENSNIEDIQKILKIAIRTSAVKHGFYVYEQRSEGDEQEHGWHIHMSVNTTYPPSKITQFIWQQLKSRGYNFNKKIAIKSTPDDGGFRDRYMQGDKSDASKDGKVKKDFILREKYGLEHFYEF